MGCAHTSHQIRKPFIHPQFGMPKRQMVDMFGEPQTIEIYQKQDNTRMEVYTYFGTYSSLANGSMPRAKVPVCLMNNKVIGWGKTFYEDHVRQDDIRIK